MTLQRSTSSALAWWETPFWHISCQFSFFIVFPLRLWIKIEFYFKFNFCLDLLAAPVLPAAWQERWPPTRWTWCGRAWWTSGFCREAPCTKERWTEWCRRGGTRDSSPFTKASGRTGCDWDLGTSSYPCTHKHSCFSERWRSFSFFQLAGGQRRGTISRSIILKDTLSGDINVRWRWFFFPLTSSNGFKTSHKNLRALLTFISLERTKRRSPVRIFFY